MLQGHVEILHGFRLFREHVEKSVADVRRIRVHHAYPLDAVNVRQLAQQTREGILLAQIFAVTRRVLGHEDDLFHTFFCELMCLGDDRAEATTAEMSTHLRNETEGTRAIAAFGDLYKGIV